MADKKKKVRFKAGAELSSSVNFVDVTIDNETQDESEVFEIVLKDEKITKADACVKSDSDKETVIKVKVVIVDDVPTIEASVTVSNGSELTKADAGFVAEHHNKLTKADAGFVAEHHNKLTKADAGKLEQAPEIIK